MSPSCLAVQIRDLCAFHKMLRGPLTLTGSRPQNHARRRTDITLSDWPHQAGTSTEAAVPGPKLAEICATDTLNGPVMPSAPCSACV